MLNVLDKAVKVAGILYATAVVSEGLDAERALWLVLIAGYALYKAVTSKPDVARMQHQALCEYSAHKGY